jgi:hypothetical protein
MKPTIAKHGGATSDTPQIRPPNASCSNVGRTTDGVRTRTSGVANASQASTMPPASSTPPTTVPMSSGPRAGRATWLGWMSCMTPSC